MENIRYGRLDASDEEVIEAAKLADVHDMILHLPHGYDTQIGEGGANLSAGQRQRVGLARALFRNPRVVVLDEPNSNLDRLGEAALARAITTLRERKTTLVMVVHHANLLQKVDKLAVLQEGRLAAFGPRNEVLSHLNSTAQGGKTAPPAPGQTTPPPAAGGSPP
jgi:ABC-type protease/lipase transport system fused ATPase/permease subunit